MLVFPIVFGTLGLTILLTAGLVSGCSPDDPSNQDAYYMGTADGVQFYTSLDNGGLSYDNVKVYCAFFGMKPAIIDTPEKDEVIHNYLLKLNSPELHPPGSNVNSRPFWLTLDDIQNEGDFRWIGSSTPPSYFNWAPGSPEPNNYHYNCVSAQLLVDNPNTPQQSYSYGWINLPCETCWRPICAHTNFGVGDAPILHLTHSNNTSTTS